MHRTGTARCCLLVLRVRSLENIVLQGVHVERRFCSQSFGMKFYTGDADCKQSHSWKFGWTNHSWKFGAQWLVSLDVYRGEFLKVNEQQPKQEWQCSHCHPFNFSKNYGVQNCCVLCLLQCREICLLIVMKSGHRIYITSNELSLSLFTMFA